MNELTNLSIKGTKKQHLLVCRTFLELLTTSLQELTLNSRTFTETIAQSKGLLSLKKMNDENKLNDGQRSLLIKAFIGHGIWVNFQIVQKMIESLLDDDIEFVRNDLLDSLSNFVSKGSDNFVQPVINILLKKVTKNDHKMYDKIAKIIDVAINLKGSISLITVKEIHQILLQKSIRMDSKSLYFMILSNIKFEVLEDQEVMHYTLKVFIEELKTFIEEFIDNSLSKGELLKKKFEGKRKPSLKNKRVGIHTLLQERMEVSSRVLNQVFKGINRIIPRIKSSPFLNTFLENNLEKFFKFCHITSSKLSIQILLFLYQIVKHDLYSSIAERYLTLFYGFLDSPTIYSSKLLEQFFDLIYTIVTSDYSTKRVCSIFKRLFKNVLHCETRVVVACLILFSKVLKEKPVLTILLKNKLGHVSQALTEQENEDYKDVELSDDDNEKKMTKSLPKEHVSSLSTNAKKGQNSQKRNPLYTGAELSALSEFLCLKTHYNPTVRKLVSLLINGETEKIDYKGNPFEDFTNVSILSRLSLNSIKKKSDTKHTIQKNAGRKIKLPPISLENYKELKFEDERAIQLYFEKKVAKGQIKAKKPKKVKNEDEDDFDEQEVDKFADDLFEKEMEKIAGKDEEDDLFDDQEDNFEEGDENVENDDENDDDFENEDDEDEDELENGQFKKINDDFNDESDDEEENENLIVKTRGKSNQKVKKVNKMPNLKKIKKR